MEVSVPVRPCPPSFDSIFITALSCHAAPPLATRYAFRMAAGSLAASAAPNAHISAAPAITRKAERMGSPRTKNDDRIARASGHAADAAGTHDVGIDA